MSNHIDSLVGRPLIASIGEPWDFESSAGTNRLEGRVVAVSGPADSVSWCMCVVSEFRTDGNPVTTVGIVRRYVESEPLLQRLRRGERVGANFLYDPSGRAVTGDEIRLTLSSKTGLRFLAGTVQVVHADNE
jgi:hypothetical protein